MAPVVEHAVLSIGWHAHERVVHCAVRCARLARLAGGVCRVGVAEHHSEDFEHLFRGGEPVIGGVGQHDRLAHLLVREARIDARRLEQVAEEFG